MKKLFLFVVCIVASIFNSVYASLKISPSTIDIYKREKVHLTACNVWFRSSRLKKNLKAKFLDVGKAKNKLRYNIQVKQWKRIYGSGWRCFMGELILPNLSEGWYSIRVPGVRGKDHFRIVRGQEKPKVKDATEKLNELRKELQQIREKIHPHRYKKPEKPQIKVKIEHEKENQVQEGEQALADQMDSFNNLQTDSVQTNNNPTYDQSNADFYSHVGHGYGQDINPSSTHGNYFKNGYDHHNDPSHYGYNDPSNYYGYNHENHIDNSFDSYSSFGFGGFGF